MSCKNSIAWTLLALVSIVLPCILFILAESTNVISLYTCGIIVAAISIIYVGVSTIFNITIIIVVFYYEFDGRLSCKLLS